MPLRVKAFHSIMPIANVASVMKYGILSYNRCKELKLSHSDISLVDVQERRDIKAVPNGLKLHDYANLYFCARNPMMYKRKSQVEDLCVLQIMVKVYKQNGVVFTDQNAGGDYVSFFPKSEVKNKINFDWVFAEFWTDEDRTEYFRKKSAKCAEILVPHQVEPEFIKGAYVVSESAKAKLLATGFSLPIVVKSSMFFR